MTPLVFSIDEPLFKTQPLFMLGHTPEQLKEHLAEVYDVNVRIDARTSGTMLTYAQAPWRVVWIAQLSSEPEDLGTLMHEIFHLVTRICSDKGVPIRAYFDNDENGDEAAAYMMDFFTRKALEHVKNHLEKEGSLKCEQTKSPSPSPTE